MKLDQKLTFLPIFYQNVAGLSADDLPGHRITLQAEDETSCSTSHVSIFFSSRDAEAYAFGVRHVAPSPPGEARAGGAMLRATGIGCSYAFFITIFTKFIINRNKNTHRNFYASWYELRRIIIQQENRKII